MIESEEELKGFLAKVKNESEKAGFKLNIQNMKIMASGLIASWANRWGNNRNYVIFHHHVSSDSDPSTNLL